ncbi:Transposase [Cordylochernes scorpioides]|uniref:Transposase n=1 Tax=Cordylochernes scorpioides TaxID=51811 RepID=A0ABY6LWB7_9ARAC|nr:Transposase [Cordylochernes scorpioides]
MSGGSMIVPFGFFRPVEESFDIFVQRFEAAFEANGLEEGKRIPIFVSLLDSEMLKLGNDLFFPSTMREQPYELFLKRGQLGNESVSEYLRELRHLAMDCTFGEMLEVMLRDRFVAGIKSESLQKKLLQEDDDVTLDRVFSIAVSFELVEQNAKELQDGLVAKMDIVPGGDGKNEARRGWQHGPDFWAVQTFYGVNSVSWCAARFIEFHDLVSEKGSRGRTISRRLVANGLHSCRPLRRLPLTPPNRRQRLEWCRARSTWMTEWHRVVFSDESRFCLSSDSCPVRVWRRRGERSNPAAIVERPTVRQRGIMVWGAIAYDSRSPLLRIQGTMTAQRYVDDVLRPVTLPYLQGVPNSLYQQDNARPHTARISQQALQDVQMLPWPPYSPDLSPIEHVWDIIGRRLHALPQPRSEDELWQMVEREWRAIPQDAIRTLIDSLPRRVAACIAVRGGPTCY